jgi:predicted nucleotidyltransferase component of viral defense system
MMEPAPSFHDIELFHVLFLAYLARGTDKRSLVLKGGCNLRFFHRSVRYSEDMDLDVDGIEPHVLRETVRAILASRPFNQVLESRGIGIEHVTEHKQTPTVQRWKLGLRTDTVRRPLPSKIEFSRRGLDDGVEFGSIDPALIASHRIAPFMVSHYGAAAALRQKVGALAHRAETQARDVFDVHHLLATGAPRDALRDIDPGTLEQARARAATIDFAVFKSQVLSYLPMDDRSRFDGPDVWDTLVLEVLEALEPVAT